MVELIEDSRVAPPKLRIIKSPRLRTITRLHVANEFGNLHDKKKIFDSRDEIPFEKWIMPPQPEGYIKSNEYDFL